ncbi:MAG: hypothetical protein JWM40_1639 [Frankiales bacterium]|nr:hypothetical protein [Frankiales bacterium]
MTASLDLEALPDLDETVLPTYSVFARFPVLASSGQDAMDTVMSLLTAAEEPFHEITVERQEPDGTWLVEVRFVLVSIDGHTAVLGLHETLRMAGVGADEVWAGEQVA